MDIVKHRLNKLLLQNNALQFPRFLFLGHIPIPVIVFVDGNIALVILHILQDVAHISPNSINILPIHCQCFQEINLPALGCEQHFGTLLQMQVEIVTFPAHRVDTIRGSKLKLDLLQLAAPNLGHTRSLASQGNGAILELLLLSEGPKERDEVGVLVSEHHFWEGLQLCEIHRILFFH